MAAQTLTTSQASYLYKRGLAIMEGNWQCITRTAEYTWDANAGKYQIDTAGLRIQHRIGARWNGSRFVKCACNHCQRYPVQAAQVDIY